MRIKLFFYIFLFALVSSRSEAAPISILFDASDNVIGVVEDFTLRLYEGIGLIYKRLYFLILSIVLPAVIYAYAKHKVNEETVIAFFLAIFLSSQIALHKEHFQTFIYDPFFDTLYATASYIAEASSTNGYHKVSGVGGMFNNIYNAVGDLTKIMDKIWDRMDFGVLSMLKGAAIMLTILIIKFLFIFLVALFAIKFTVAVFSVHIMMIIMPITLSLFPFKSLRAYSFNHIKSLFQYGLTIVFYCISIAVSIILIDQLSESASELYKSKAKEFDYQFLVSAVISAGMGYLMMLASSEFASKILNVAGTSSILANSAMNKMAGLAAGATAAAPVLSAINSYTGGSLMRSRGLGQDSASASSGSNGGGLNKLPYLLRNNPAMSSSSSASSSATGNVNPWGGSSFKMPQHLLKNNNNSNSPKNSNPNIKST